jgi:7,8-dihydroneopterin aldolase/epimerase/oxygenase
MKNTPSDSIEIRGLRVTAHIGVPAAERDQPQELLVDLQMSPKLNFSQMPDALDATVDYAAVAQRIVAIAADRPRQLIETLADEIAMGVLRDHAVLRVEVRVRKFILPDTEYVAVHCVRERNR